MHRLAWCLRVRLPAQIRVWRNACRHLDRRARVEQALLDCAAGRRALPDAEDCRGLALYLGGQEDRLPGPRARQSGGKVVPLRRK